MKKVVNTVKIALLVGLAFLFACGQSPKDKKRDQIRGRIDEIRETLLRRSQEAIYGPPEMMKEWEEANRRLEAEADSLEQVLKDMEKER